MYSNKESEKVVFAKLNSKRSNILMEIKDEVKTMEFISKEEYRMQRENNNQSIMLWKN